jgi:hypothetical protein
MVGQKNKRETRLEKPAKGKPNKNVTLISFKEKDIKQRWLITSDGCPSGAQLKRDFKKEIKSGKIKLTDVGDDKGFEIISELGIDSVPIFIVELNDGFPIRYLIDE